MLISSKLYSYFLHWILETWRRLYMTKSSTRTPLHEERANLLMMIIIRYLPVGSFALKI